MIYTTHYNSPLGSLLLAEREGSLFGLWLAGQEYKYGIAGDEVSEKQTAILSAAGQWLDRYFSGDKPEISELPLNLSGSEFQQTVWKMLCEIPYGETTTYGELAKRLAAKMGKQHMSAQAVGGAVGHNRISIIVPCHRVVGANGNLTGYAGGISAKLQLLAHEGVDITKFCAPKTNAVL